MKRIICIATIVLCSLASSNVWAQEKAQEAYEAFMRANRLVSAGAVTRSIPHYEKVIRLAPERYPDAYFNLAEVYRVKKNAARAALYFQAFTRLSNDETSIGEAKAALATLVRADWKKMTVRVDTETAASIFVDGAFFSRGEKELVVSLPAGTYPVQVKATDYEDFATTVDITESKTVTLAPTKLKFWGNLTLSTEIKNARARVFEGTSEKSKLVVEFEIPGKPVKLTEGRHFVEVTAPGYDRWIRNVAIPREETANVVVRMTRAKPPELR